MADDYKNLSREELVAELRRLRAGEAPHQAERALKESEARFRSAMEHAPIGMVLTALDGRYLQINRAFCAFLGYDKEELERLSFQAISRPAEAAVDLANMKRLLAGETGTYRREKLYLRKDGRSVWGDLTVSLLRDAGGAPLYFIAQLVDIDESRRATEALRKSAEEVEDLYERSPCGYHSLNRDGTVIRINHTELQWLGYEWEEVVGKRRFSDLLTPASQEAFRRNYPAFKERGYVHNLEYEMRRKDGSVLPVLLSATAVTGPDGEYLMSRSTVHDISARKQAEQAVKESEERFRTVADTVPIIIWMADVDEESRYTGCTFFNQGWHDFTGLSLERTRGLHWMELVHPDDRERCLATYTDAFRSALPFKQAYRLKRHDGKYRWMQESGTPRFAGDGRFLGHIGTCVDITRHVQAKADRARQQVAMERSARLNIAGEMASGLTHELSQPINATLNYLDACLRRLDGGDLDPGKQRQGLSLALKQAQRAGRIINNFKALIRRRPSPRTPLDLNGLLRGTVDLLEYEIEQHGVTIAFDLEHLPPVLGNQVEIQQVLLNVMKNAVDAMSNAPRRELRLVSRPIEQQRVRVEICDSGPGIADAQLESIFQPFHTTKGDGLGLGLAICRTLVEDHGGRIWAKSTPGGDTCFNIVLPAQNAA
jgi:PAS domain S-box